jgi:hypothetical protein
LPDKNWPEGIRMSPRVLDVLLVKKIEREIKRKLDPEELEALRFGETIYHQKANGVILTFTVPTYTFPQDLMVKEADLYLSDSHSFWDYAFNNGPIVETKVKSTKVFE